MMKKRLSKTLWYGSDIDKEGKPVLPPLADEANDLEGIHEGELYLHLGDGSALLFTRSADGQVVQLGSNADELANYLLKSVWDKAFEIRTTENGEEYLFTKLNLATQYGITMYANGGLLDLPNIFEGIPFDNKTIWLNPETKLVEVIGSTEEDEGGADFSNVKTSGEGNAFTSFVLSEDGKELTFVKGETFAKQSDFTALNTKVTDFLEGSDTDNIINKWKELEAFLSGMKESDDLATILATKWTKDEAKIANWDAAFGWGDHSKAGYLKKEAIYDESIGCWKLEGDLLVTGGITMYANEGQYTPSTITDAVNIDGNTLIRVNGVIMLNPDIEIGGGSDIDLSEYAKKATTLSGYGITDAYTKNAVDGLLEDKADTATTLAGYGITNAYTKTQVDNLLGDFVTSDDVETLLYDYLPLTGGTITGDLRLRKGTEYTSPYLYFGDSDEVWMKEAADKHLTIHADGSVKIDSPKTIIDGIEIKKSASGVLFIDANLVVSGGITMYGTDGTTANTIWDDAPIASTSVKGIASFDSNFFAVNNGKVTFIGSTGGGTADSVAWEDITGKPSWIGSSKPSYSYSEITGTPTSLKNPNSLSWSGYSSGSYDGSSAKSITIPSNTNQLTNGAGFITSSGSVAYATSAGSAEDADYATTSGSCSGNAATSTTLKTSRTIWGQSFNGSKDVSGNLKLGSSNLMMESDNSYGDSSWAIFAYGPTLQFKYGSSGGTASTMAFQISSTDGQMKVYGDIIPSSNQLYDLGSSSYQWANVYTDCVNIKTGENAYTDADIYFKSGSTTYARIGSNTSGNLALYARTSIVIRGGATSSSAPTNGVTIDSSGNLLTTGGITMYSDLRKKTILNHVELSLKEVADAPLIEHYYNSDESKRTHVGSIAQYWARLNDWFCKEDEEGYLTMEIQNAALASAISVARELTRYESKTDKQIKKLKKRIGELEEEIENLKNK